MTQVMEFEVIFIPTFRNRMFSVLCVSFNLYVRIMFLKVTRKRALTAVCAAEGGKYIAAGTLHGDVLFVQHTDCMGEVSKTDK
jgi:hypothetical protein